MELARGRVQGAELSGCNNRACISSMYTLVAVAADGLLATLTLLFSISSSPAAAFVVFFSGLGCFK